MLSNNSIDTFNSSSKEKYNYIKNIIIDSKSGYSGAGRGVHKKYKNKNLYESLSVYGIKTHRHNSEIQQELILKLVKMLNLLLLLIYHQCLEEF